MPFNMDNFYVLRQNKKIRDEDELVRQGLIAEPSAKNPYPGGDPHHNLWEIGRRIHTIGQGEAATATPCTT